MYVCMYVCVDVWMYVKHVYKQMCIYVYIYIYTCIQSSYANTCTHIRIFCVFVDVLYISTYIYSTLDKHFHKFAISTQPKF